MYFLKRTVRDRPQPLLDDINSWPGSQLLARLAWSRGVRDSRKLENAFSYLPHFNELDGTEEAARIVANHIESKNKICIVGDYDADGATSTALMIDFLRQIGVKRIDFMIPDRFVDGYGLKTAMAERIVVSGYDLVITVDNGISSHQAVDYLRKHGVDVVITDHHVASEDLPLANAIVNPSINKTSFAAPNLAGVGVAFYTLLAVRAELENRGYFEDDEKPNMSQWLDLVAIGTVADVVPLDHANRILVSNGLKRMRANRARAGIKALIKACKRDFRHISSQDLAFGLGPTLNATGRLDDMRLGVLCLLSNNPAEADELAQQMRGFNEDRKEVEVAMVREGLKRIRDNNHAGMVLYQSDWHEGVLGLVAARIKERFLKPCVALTKAEEEGVIKGSARSIQGVHIRDILVEVDNAMTNGLKSFGGHAAAAGVSLAYDDIDDFRHQFERIADSHCQNNVVDPHEILVDGELDLAHFGIDDCYELETGLPWGQHFSEPKFRQIFTVTSVRPLGAVDARHLALTVKIADNPLVFNAVLFGYKDKALSDAPQIEKLIGAQINAVYRASINRWRGREQLQLMFEYFELIA